MDQGTAEALGTAVDILAFAGFGLWTLICIGFGASIMHRIYKKRPPMGLPKLTEEKWMHAVLGGIIPGYGEGRKEPTAEPEEMEPKPEVRRANPSHMPGGGPRPSFKDITAEAMALATKEDEEE